MKNIRKKIYYLMVILMISSLPLVFSHPPEDENCSNCHSDGNYSIETPNDLTLYYAPNVTFSLNISATGEDVHVWIHPQARDNINFTVQPVFALMDNDASDLNPTKDQIFIIFNITTPLNSGTYHLLVHAQNPDYIEPHLVFLEFTIYVDEKYADSTSTWFLGIKTWIQIHIFSHLNIYLGTMALICLGTATILMELDTKHIKLHGKLSLTAFLLTSMNIFLTLNESITVIRYWINGTSIDWGHLTHFIFGSIGYCAGLIGLIQGIAGHPMKKWGYIALICWSFNFIFGIIYWGVGI